MPKFATYLHAETTLTSKPPEEIQFVGYSYHHFNELRAEMQRQLSRYPALLVREAAYENFATIHDSRYLETIRQLANGEQPAQLPLWSIECTGMQHCLPGYRYSLGGMCEAVDQMKRGDLERAYCFGLGGHHAFPARGHGYCILNTEAAAIRYAQKQGFEHVLIVDWDIHHGDGTQTIFANDPTVYQISIHSAVDLYMTFARSLRLGTTTAGDQAGHCNIPILHDRYDQAFWDKIHLEGVYYRGTDSLRVFREKLDQLPWTPDLISIMSGYDSHKDDCGEDTTNWTNEDYQTLTRIVIEASRKAHCPIISSHGGGYKLEVTLAAALAHVEILANE